jgi:hypothetical protein
MKVVVLLIHPITTIGTNHYQTMDGYTVIQVLILSILITRDRLISHHETCWPSNDYGTDTTLVCHTLLSSLRNAAVDD